MPISLHFFRLCFVLALLKGLGAFTALAQTELPLKGIVRNMTNDSGIDHVQVSSGTGTDVTKNGGHFTLYFKGKVPGEAIALSITSRKFKPAIPEQLTPLLSKDPDRVTVIYVERYTNYEILYRDAQEENRKMAQEISRLENDLKLAHTERLLLKDSLQLALKANQSFQAALLKLQATVPARQFASNAEDSVLQLAYDAFSEGEMELAIEMLSGPGLAGQLNAAQEQVKDAERTIAESQQTIQDITDKYYLLAQAYLGIGDFETAFRYYDSTLWANPADLDMQFEYGLLLQQQRQASAALPVYYFASLPARPYSDLYTISLHNQGAIYCDLQRYDLAEKAFRQVLNSQARFFKTNSVKYGLEFAITLNNLGTLNRARHQYDAAKANYLLASKHLTSLKFSLADSSSQANGLAMTLNNLGLVYTDLHLYDSAKLAHRQALQYYRGLTSTNPERFTPLLAASLNSLGMLYQNLHQYDSAIYFYRQAYDMQAMLSENNLAKYAPELASICHNLGAVYQGLHLYDSAKQACLKACHLYATLDSMSSVKYAPYLARARHSVGTCYYNLALYDSALLFYQQAHDHWLALYKASPTKYAPDLALSLNQQGMAFQAMQAYDTALPCFYQALEIGNALHKLHPVQHAPALAGTLLNLATLYAQGMANYDSAVWYSQKAIVALRPLPTKLRQQHATVVLRGYILLALSSLNMLKEEQGLKPNTMVMLKEGVAFCDTLGLQTRQQKQITRFLDYFKQIMDLYE